MGRGERKHLSFPDAGYGTRDLIMASSRRWLRTRREMNGRHMEDNRNWLLLNVPEKDIVEACEGELSVFEMDLLTLCVKNFQRLHGPHGSTIPWSLRNG